ncbi:hypothetical protein AB0D11_47830 [Streptomyces monashensis]
MVDTAEAAGELRAGVRIIESTEQAAELSGLVGRHAPQRILHSG